MRLLDNTARHGRNPDEKQGVQEPRSFMCLAIPAQIVELNGANAVVEVQGVRRAAVVSLIREPKLGDYVLVHAGFAIRKWSEEDVREYNEITRGLDLGRG